MIQFAQVCKRYPNGQDALRQVNFEIASGEMAFLTGHSGAGKSTLLKLICLMERATSGQIIINGKNLNKVKRRKIPAVRRDIGMIFQDALGSLNPRIPLGEAVAEPLRFLRGLSKDDARTETAALLERVGLDPGLASRYPSELSGGQAQRAALARALAGEPRFLIADEPVSALDVSIQAQVLNLLKDLQEKNNFALILITHDLSLLPFMCGRAVVLYRGKIVEEGKPRDLLSKPRDPYTKSLVAASRLVPPSSLIST